MPEDKEIRTPTRSSAYPANSLQRSVEDVETLNEKLGKGSFDRATIANGLGYSGVSGASAARVAALAHFGLLERSGDSYQLSVLADRVLHPVSDTDRATAIEEAALCPKLFRSLMDVYRGQKLPAMLKNILTRQYRINDRVADNVKDIFQKSMTYAGLMSEEGILGETVAESDRGRIDTGESSSILNAIPVIPRGNISIKLPGGVVVQFPQSFDHRLAVGSFASGIHELTRNLNEAGYTNDNM